MPVTKIPAEAYSLRTEHKIPEWGTFYVRQWERTENGTTYYGGELAAYTSYGAYAYHWTHCAEPFKAFLCQIDFDYFMQKAYPKYQEFDFDGSLAAIRGVVLDHRRRTDIDAKTAATIWEGLQDIEDGGDCGAHAFVEALYRVDKLRKVTQAPYEYSRERASAQAEGFWRELWPLFTAALRTEMAANLATKESA